MQKNPASWNSEVGNLPEMYLQTSAETYTETGSRPSLQVVSKICRIPDKQTEWSTGDPDSVFLFRSPSNIAAKLVLLV